jgi:hypothetical protein
LWQRASPDNGSYVSGTGVTCPKFRRRFLSFIRKVFSLPEDGRRR